MFVILTYQAIQGCCSACGGFATIHPPGIDERTRATRRLMHLVSRLVRYMPLSHVADILPVWQPTAFRQSE